MKAIHFRFNHSASYDWFVICYLSNVWCMAVMVEKRLHGFGYRIISSWLAIRSNIAFVYYSRNDAHSKRSESDVISEKFGTICRIYHHICCDLLHTWRRSNFRKWENWSTGCISFQSKNLLQRQNEKKLNINVQLSLQNISLITMSIGILMVAVFQSSLIFGDYSSSLKQSSKVCKSNDNENQLKQRPRKNFFKSLEMYQNSLLYIYSRVLSVLAIVYIPLWLDEHTGVNLVAVVPLISYIVSFLSSLPMDYFIRWFGHNFMYLSGVLIYIIGCILIEMNHDSSNTMFYIIASCLGAGSSITTVCSLCSIADMVADHSDQSGSVYSIVSTADKLILGIFIMAIQTKWVFCHFKESRVTFYF